MNPDKTKPSTKEGISYWWIWVLGMSCVLILMVYALWLSQDYQTEKYVPNIDNWDCEKLGKWIIEKRLHGNGFEVQAAKQFADIYPVKCGGISP